MKPIKRLLPLFSLGCLLGWVAWGGGNTIWVAPPPQGSDVTGDGSSGSPYATIQNAFDLSASGDTIRVLPGTYNECLDISGLRFGNPPPVHPVRLVADDWITNGNNDTTIIDGQGICDITSGTPGPVLYLWGNGMQLEGFTITNGGESGIDAEGSVAITHNVVTGNNGVFGGGIYFYNGPCFYGDTDATISNNSITQNAAYYRASTCVGASPVCGTDGGGLFAKVHAFGPDNSIPCVSGESAALTVQGNTIDGNIAEEEPNGSSVGGGVAITTSSDITGTVDVVVTQNEITGNSIDPLVATNSVAYGGGLFATTYGYGQETIEVRENLVTENSSSLDGGGITVVVDTFNNGDHAVTAENNQVLENIASGNGGGIDAFLRVQATSASPDGARMRVIDNRIEDNDALGDLGGGGGLLMTYSSILNDQNASFDVVRNQIVGNLADFSGGGAAAIVTADADPATDGSVVGRTTAHVNFYNNVVGGNDVAGAGEVGGGLFLFLQAFGDAAASFEVQQSTIAGNTAPADGGGIHIESFTLPVGTRGDGPITGALLTVDRSIIAGNDPWGIGGPVPGTQGWLTQGGTGDLTINLTSNDFFSNVAGAIQPTLTTPPNDHVNESGTDTTNPQLDPLTFESGVCPRRFGAGPVALADISGDGVVDGIDVLRVAVAFGAVLDDVRFNSLADLDGDGDVDGDDLALVAVDFGDSCP